MRTRRFTTKNSLSRQASGQKSGLLSHPCSMVFPKRGEKDILSCAYQFSLIPLFERACSQAKLFWITTDFLSLILANLIRQAPTSWFPGNHSVPFQPRNELLEALATRTRQPGSCVVRGLMKSFSGGFLVSISLLRTDLEYFIKTLIFNSLTFESIPVIWNHLVGINGRLR